MATPGISAPAEQRIKIRDSYLEDNYKNTGSGADIDIINLTPAAAFETTNVPRSGQSGQFEPRGISIDAAIDSDENPDLTATSAILYCRYKNDPNVLAERFSCAITHPCRIRVIRPYQTTARGIHIKA